MQAKKLVFGSILLTFALLLLGGVVHNTQSSLACPDWPLCFGQFFPKMEGGVLIEHSHRLLASLIGLLMIALVFVTYRTKTEFPRRFQLSCWALGLVIFQGVLGGITVIYRLPTIVSTTHLAFSMIFFCTLIYIHHWIGTEEAQQKKNADVVLWGPSVSQLMIFVGVLFYLQMLLGAFLRHSGAGSACGLGPSNAIMCRDLESWALVIWPQANAAKVHMFHRLFGSFLGIFSFVASFYALAKIKNTGLSEKRLFTLKVCLWAIPFFVLIQVILGVLTVAGNISIVPTTAHLGIAALCLGVFWKIALEMGTIEKEHTVVARHNLISDLFEITKPKLSALVMVTTFAGMVFAPVEDVSFFKGVYSLVLIYLVVMGSGALNCFMEIETDRRMLRTKDRPMPSGRLNPNVALWFGVALHVIAIPLLIFHINLLTGLLALSASVLYLFAYTPMKKMSEWAVVVGAIPGALPPLMGVTTFTGSIEANGLSIFLILFIWQLPHFLAISIFHKEDYDSAGFKIFPLSKGIRPTRNSIFFYTLILFMVAALPSLIGGASRQYLLASVVLSSLFLFLGGEGFIVDSNEAVIKKWARKYFWGSIIYLPLLFAALMFLR